MITFVQIVRGPAREKFGKDKKLKIWPDFRQLWTLTANILRTNRDVKNRKQSQSTLIRQKNRWTLVQ